MSRVLCNQLPEFAQGLPVPPSQCAELVQILTEAPHSYILDVVPRVWFINKKSTESQLSALRAAKKTAS